MLSSCLLSEERLLSRETFRRTLRGKGPLSLKVSPSKKREGEILHVAKSPVFTMAPTTPIYDAIQLMTKKGFRRIPIANPGTKSLEGVITATDIIDYLGGGKKFEIIEQRFGGNFFKAINEPIRLIMTKNVVSIKASAKISEAIELMTEKNLGGLPVVDDDNRVRAIITERDIASLFADRISETKVAQIMSERVVTALPKTTIFEAEKTMVTQGFRRLPIISDGKVIGIITAMDIMRFFGTGDVFKYLQSGTIIQVLNTSALEIATKEVLTVEPNANVGQAAKIMRDKNIGAIPVVKSEKLVGIITERDFFKIIE
jgi:CBS domain-containing protein